MHKIAALALALLTIVSAAYAHSYKQGNISIGHPWAQPIEVGQMRQMRLMFPLLNAGKEGDALLSIIAENIEAEFWQTTKKLSRIDIPPGRPIAMRPDGLHIRLNGLPPSLKMGEHIAVELNFEKSGTITVDAVIANQHDGHYSIIPKSGYRFWGKMMRQSKKLERDCDSVRSNLALIKQGVDVVLAGVACI